MPADSVWARVGLATKKDINMLQRSIVMVGAIDNDDRFHACGTAFLVHTAGRHSVYLSVWHVLKYAMQRVMPEWRAQRPAEDWNDADFNQAVDCRRLFVYSEQFPYGKPPRIVEIRSSPEPDLGIFITESDRTLPTNPRPPLPVVSLNSDLLPVGTRLIAALPNMDDPTQHPDSPTTYSFGRDMRVQVGTITGFVRRGLLVKCPAYVTSMPANGGMSGSPVFAYGTGENVQMSAIGVLSHSGLLGATDFDNQTVYGLSTVVPIVYAYGLRTPIRLRGDGSAMRFSELIERGLVRDHGSRAANIRVEVQGRQYTVWVPTFPGMTFDDWERTYSIQSPEAGP